MDEGIVRSVDELARALGRKPRSTHYLLNAGMRDACRFSDGTYSIELAEEWLQQQEPTKGKRAKADDPLVPLKKRHIRARIALSAEDLRTKRLKNDVATGALVYRDDVVAEFSMLLAHAKPICEALPDEVAKEVPAEVRVQILQLMKEAMSRFYHKLRSWQPVPPDEHLAGPTAESA